MARIISLSVLLTLIVVFGVTFFRVLAPFLLPLFIAGVMAVLCQPVLDYFTRRTKGRKRLAAGLTTGSILAIILVPLLVGTLIGALQLFAFVIDNQNSDKFKQAVSTIQREWSPDAVVAKIENWFDKDDSAKDSSTDSQQGPSNDLTGDNTIPQNVGPDVVDQTDTPPDSERPAKVEPTDVAAEPDAELAETPAVASADKEQTEPNSNVVENETNSAESTTADTTKNGSDEEAAIQTAEAPSAEPEQKKELIKALTKIGSPDVDSTVDKTIVDEPPGSEVEELSNQFEHNVKTAVTGLVQKTWGLAGVAAGAAPRVAFGLLDAIVTGLISSLMFVIALYYFLADGPALIDAAEGLIPMNVTYQRELLDRFQKIVRAVALATFLAAIAQGITTALTLSLLGYEHFFFFAVVGTLSAMIPLAGTWLVWGPCAIHLISEGHYGSAIFLILFGLGVIGTMDNLIRTYVLQSDVKLHPLLAFVSVMGGLKVMGLWGVFVGPMIASVLHALIQIFNVELVRYSQERSPLLAGNAATDAALLNINSSSNAQATPAPVASIPETTIEEKNTEETTPDANEANPAKGSTSTGESNVVADQPKPKRRRRKRK